MKKIVLVLLLLTFAVPMAADPPSGQCTASSQCFQDCYDGCFQRLAACYAGCSWRPGIFYTICLGQCEARADDCLENECACPYLCLDDPA